jgi:hypothetical protein
MDKTRSKCDERSIDKILKNRILVSSRKLRNAESRNKERSEIRNTNFHTRLLFFPGTKIFADLFTKLA